MSVEIHFNSGNKIKVAVKSVLGGSDGNSSAGAVKKIQKQNTAGETNKDKKSAGANKITDYQTVLPKMQVHAQNIASAKTQAAIKAKLLEQYGDYIDVTSVAASTVVRVDDDFRVYIKCDEKSIRFNTDKFADDSASFNNNASDDFIPYKDIYEDSNLYRWMKAQYQEIEEEDISQTNNIEQIMQGKRGEIFSPYNKRMGQGGFQSKKETVSKAVKNMASTIEKEIVNDINEKMQKDYGLSLSKTSSTKYRL